MVRIQNERGGALVLVLMIIMLLALFVTMQGIKMANTKKQIEVAKKNLDAKNLALMGVERFGSAVEKDLKENYDHALSPTENVNEIGSFDKVELDPNRSFKISDIHVQSNGTTVEFISTGIAFGKEAKEHSKIKIKIPDKP